MTTLDPIEKAIVLCEMLASLNIGFTQASFHNIPRALFDAHAGEVDHFEACDSHRDFWTKHITHAGLMLYTHEPPKWWDNGQFDEAAA